MPSVFISHGDPDAQFAAALDKELRRNGVNSMIFPRDAIPGEKLHQFMRNAVSNTDKTILVCSRASMSRLGVRNEIEEALQKEARDGGVASIIPITRDKHIFEDWNPSDLGMKQAILARVVADFSTSKVGTREFNEEVAKLVQAVFADTFDELAADVVWGRTRIWIRDPEGRKETVVHDLRIRATSARTKAEVPSLQTSNGHIIPVSFNLGSFVGLEEEGGQSRATYLLNEPLIPGKDYYYRFVFDIEHDGPEDVTSWSSIILAPYAFYRMDVYLPPERPVKSARLYKMDRQSRREVPGEFVLPSRAAMRVRIQRPPLHTRYFFMWEW